MVPSYRERMNRPAWLLYDGPKLVASCRAETADRAKALFDRAGLTGTSIRLSYEERGHDRLAKLNGIGA